MASRRKFSPISTQPDISPLRQPAEDGFQKFLLRTPFLKKRLLSLFLVFFGILALAAPAQAHAGFFSDLLSMIIGKAEGAAPLESSAATLSLPLLGSGGNGLEDRAVADGASETDETPLAAVEESALVATRNPQGTLASTRDQIAVYTVQPGDTPAEIAEKFNISLNTLFWANDLNSARMLKVGDTLVILPVSGVKYQVRKGDTIEGIAKKFNGDVGDILSFNGLVVGEALDVGITIIIPDGEVATPVSSLSPQGSSKTRVAALPQHKGYYMRPVIGGRKSRGIHGYNGVDLAQTCGEPVLASAEGTIIIARASGWNGGYGKYVVVAHPNGTQTLYAHLSKILGSVGQKIAQSSQIATIGSTGNSTGCHVHFEIRGAKNPF